MMMGDKKNIIEDGILEQYILGELHPSDEKYIEQVLASDKELKAHFDILEADFEKLGFENAITPPKSVKDNLIKDIRQSKSSLQNEKAFPSSNSFKFYFGIAASFAGLLLVSSIWLYSQLNKLESDFQTVQTDKKELNSKLDQLSKTYKESSEFYAVLSHPETKQYVLEGNDLMPDGKLVSYVNHNIKSVVINTEGLPELDADHDYQMWADVDGEMINMGIIDKTQPLLAMNYINHSESLNITVEPSGGSEHPTVERLVTNIYL
ncbi:anti-sigma factor [Winogradskyella sp. DF17]|uniref:Anti-sigma factor n=1 Tax=Winogradskyella pelagia TaxID=2819984 RepID=A0ABS3T0G4_9FLAO|nr:anti-sigma factor [Winogradskyella sp. DF17]MBO3116234.1 anti-sigma factor [Winogradskyella sp. DF17]